MNFNIEGLQESGAMDHTHIWAVDQSPQNLSCRFSRGQFLSD